jgi:Domain of unknown function (DUF4153)
MPAQTARRLLLVGLVGGAAADILFDRVGLGINVPIAVVAILVSAFAVRRAEAHTDRLDVWLPLVAIVAAVLLAVRDDPVVTFLDLSLAGVATLASVVALSGVAVTRRSLLAVTSLGLLAGGWLGIGTARLLGAANSDGALRDAGAASRRSIPIIRGLLIALPIVVVFTALLASADAVFAHVVDVTLRLPVDLSDLSWRAGFTLVAAWGLGGTFAIAARAVPVAVDDLGLDELAAAVRSSGMRLSAPTEATVVLLVVDALFAIFVVLQLAYLFGGADTLAAAGITYSDYARAGYFQLVAVVVGAGILLLITAAAAARPEGGSHAFVAAALGLVGVTAVILASAAVRLGLYQQAYGWTELRFYVAASIAWLAIAGVVATVLLVRDRMGWLVHGLAIGAVAVTLAISVLGPQSFITSQNLARALDPSLVPPDGHSGLDAEYLASLGDDAIPALVDALPRLDPASQTAIRPALDQRRVDLALDPAGQAPQAWNLSRERAREALTAEP